MSDRGILLFARDPGSANPIIAVYELLQDAPRIDRVVKDESIRAFVRSISPGPDAPKLCAFAKDYARQSFAAAGIAVEDWGSVVLPGDRREIDAHDAITRLLVERNIETVITGISDNDDHTHLEIWRSARNAGIRSIAFVDGYAFSFMPNRRNLQRRFVGSNGEMLYPDRVYVANDACRACLLEVGIPAAVVSVFADVHLERSTRLARTVSADAIRAVRRSWGAGTETVVLFVSEPVAEMRGYGNFTSYDEFKSLNKLIERIDAGGALGSFSVNSNNTRVVVRLHPRDRADKYDSYTARRKPRIVVSAAGSSLEAILAADVIAGMTSMFLTEAEALDKPVIRLVDPERFYQAGDSRSRFRALELAAPLQKALRAWTARLDDAGANWLALRDYEGLPARAGLDLDVLVAPEALTLALDAGMETARDYGVNAYARRKGPHAAKLMWICPEADPARRQWLLVDLQTRLSLGRGRDLRAAEIGVETLCQEGLRLRAPDAEWRVVLAVVHALRKGMSVVGDSTRLKASLEHDGARRLLARVLGVDAVPRLAEALGESEPRARERALAVVARGLGIAGYRRSGEPGAPGWRARLSRFVFYKLFFLHRHEPPFFVITGADGVGKTTLVSELLKLFEQYPVTVERFHHLADTKEPGWTARGNPPGSGTQPPEPRRGLAYRLMRMIWRRAIPGWVKQPVIGVHGELRYGYRVNALIGDAFFGGRACLVDRYVYDRMVRLRFDRRHPLQRLAGRLNCRLLRPPRLVVMLRDSPQRIHARKPELSVAQIATYQSELAALCGRSGAPLNEIDVAGRAPDAIAREVAGLIFDSLGASLFDLTGAWKKAGAANG